MKVYRVYENFYHPNGDVGTIEYGIFPTKKTAENRIREVWVMKMYPTEYIDKYTDYWYTFKDGTVYAIMIFPMYMGKKLNQRTVQVIVPPVEKYPV